MARRRLRSAWLAAVALWLAASALAAEDHGGWPLDPTQESVLAWASAGVIGAAALAIGILLFLLLRRRSRLLEPTSKWLLLIALAIIPAFVLIGANGVVLTESKSVPACGTCHVMQPFIDAMQDPNGDLLAAVHYKNRYIPDHQCYTCHSGYGIFGDTKAKTKGVGHLVKYYTDSYPKPIRHPGPFDMTHCLKCHGQAKIFLDREEHQGEDFWNDLKAGKQTCFDCHGRAHPEFEK